MSKNEKDFDDVPFYKRIFDRIQTLRFSVSDPVKSATGQSAAVLPPNSNICTRNILEQRKVDKTMQRRS